MSVDLRDDVRKFIIENNLPQGVPQEIVQMLAAQGIELPPDATGVTMIQPKCNHVKMPTGRCLYCKEQV